MEKRLSGQEVIRRAKERLAQIDAIKKQANSTEKPAPKPGKEEDGITIKSSAPGSDKRFRITVDDSGVISAAEIK